MNEIIKKIDEEILNIEKCIADTQRQCKSLNMKCNVSHQMTTRRALEWAKGIVQAEQKKLSFGEINKSFHESEEQRFIENNIRVKTNFDVITEEEKINYTASGLSLATCSNCKARNYCHTIDDGNEKDCTNILTDWLNQKAEEE